MIRRLTPVIALTIMVLSACGGTDSADPDSNNTGTEKGRSVSAEQAALVNVAKAMEDHKSEHGEYDPDLPQDDAYDYDRGYEYGAVMSRSDETYTGYCIWIFDPKTKVSSIYQSGTDRITHVGDGVRNCRPGNRDKRVPLNEGN